MTAAELLADIERGAEDALLGLLHLIVGAADQKQAIAAATDALTRLANEATDDALRKLP
jgi:hypothetical protein